jgi:hypothetical protein
MLPTNGNAFTGRDDWKTNRAEVKGREGMEEQWI